MNQIQRISDPGDPRLTPFSVQMRKADDQQSDFFVAEGRILIEGLARQGVSYEGILLSDVHENLIATEFSHIECSEWLVVPTSVLHSVAGFRFHGGMIGLGPRPKMPSLREIIAAPTIIDRQGLVACAYVNQQDNLGLIARSARAFGYRAILTTTDSGDPWSRRGLRVSMGATLLTPVVRSGDVVEDLLFLKNNGFAVIGANSSPTSRPFSQVERPRKFVIVLGNEATGLTKDVQEVCTTQVHIPMVPGHDSLNVSVAGGILMQHFMSLMQ